MSGGPNWVVPLGRKDSLNASLSGSNSNIPASNDSFEAVLTKFNRHGLDITDLVALSGKLPYTQNHLKNHNLAMNFMSF